MAVEIIKVETKSQLKQFVRYNYELYRYCKYAVPELYEDAMNTLRKDRNAAFEFCEADYFLAMREGRIVGRVAAIINHRANEKWGAKTARFGWVDFVDDEEVSEALMNKVEQWARERGMNEVHGPLGFTDFDREGLLVEGFDRLGTMATIYNYPYYAGHLERLGYEKDADWVEFLIKVPEKTWDKADRISAIVKKRYNLRVVSCESRAELSKRYGKALFDLVNECYSPLYGYSPLSDKQIEQFIKQYLPVIDLRLVSLVVDGEDNLVAIGVSLVSLSEALQKAKGRLLPFGWFHLAKALFFSRPKRLDFLLVAVKPEYQSKGVMALLFNDLMPRYISMGFEDVETNPELETNNKVQAQWENFEKEQHKRRRAFKKVL